jgi:type I restriction enzyme S subunit
MGLQTKKIKYAEHWGEIELNDLCNKITDGTHHTPTYLPNGVAFISVKDINDNKVDFSKCKYISKEQHNELIQRCHPEKDDLLVTKSGTIGRMAIVPEKPEFSLFVSVALIKNKKHYITTKFLKFCLENFFNSISIDQDIKGGLLKNFHLEDIRLTPAPVVSIPEQHRIVSKLEELFISLDKGIESITTAEKQLEIYRQAVLGKAFEGAFTANWRKEHPNADANKEFEIIKAAREELYTKKIEEWTLACEQAKVKDDKKPSKPKKPYAGEPITEEERANFDVIDKSWALIRFIDLIKYEEDAIKRGPFGSAIKKSFFVPSGYKVYEQQNAISDDATLGKYYINEEKYQELIGFSVKPGDYILSCSGTIGRISKLPANCEPGLINQALMKIRLDEELMSSKYFLYLFRSEVFQRRILKGSRGTGMQNLAGIDEIKELIIALPPKAEQVAIVLDIESRLSVCDKIEESITHSLLQAEALRQSILKKAFEGNLVEQDQNDEPASVLLERIKAEREKNKPVKKVKEKKVKQTKSKKTVTA